MELLTRTTRTMLKGQHITPVPRPVDATPTYPKGRICSRPACNHPLSIYNPGPECHACWMASLPPEERLAA